MLILNQNLLMVKAILQVFFIFVFSSSQAQIRTGLKVYREFDPTRTFDTIASSAMHKRPVKIDLFYPSSDLGTVLPLRYGAILNMYSNRMDYHITQDSAEKVSEDLAKVFADYLKLDYPEQYIQYSTGIYSDLKLPVQKLPLIVYAAGMNGSSWENVVLFDSLCKAGYVVAAVSSVGLFPGYMSTAPDITEQVKDVLFAKDKISQLPFIDKNKIGFLSWSLGGSAVSKAAMISNDIKCILSYDGTEIHYYGVDSAWDTQFDEMIALEPSDASAIKVPYLYVSSDRPKADKMYNIFDHIASKEKYFVKITEGTHEDFSSITTIANDIKPGRTGADLSKTDQIWQLTRTFFDQFLKGKSSVYLKELIERFN